MIFSGVLDLLSLGLIAPYISAIFDINQTQKYIFFFDLANYEKNDLIFYFTIFLIFIFFIKTFLSIFTRWLIALFATIILQFLSKTDGCISEYELPGLYSKTFK